MRISDDTLPINIGDFSWLTASGVRHLAMLLPCGHHANLPVEGDRRWQWNGDEDAPSLTPSILCCPGDCNWLGYMTVGALRSV
jgi:hypothetical protein